MLNAATGPQNNLMRQSMQLEQTEQTGRLSALIQKFRRDVEQQQRHDDRIMAAVMRVLRSPGGEPLRQMLREFRT